MAVRNELDRFHLVADVIDRLPKLGARAADAKQAIRDKLVEHELYICEHGDDVPEITCWQWGREAAAAARSTSTEADNV
jgi:xylulose-5-phosphate/fructose-6-phosphate phosphoketolase